MPLIYQKKEILGTIKQHRAIVEKLRQLVADDKARNYEKAYELYMVVIEDIGVYLFDKESQKNGREAVVDHYRRATKIRDSH